jgi:YD repeat-containing protein
LRIYVLRLTASDSVFTVHSDVTITVKPANLPPVVNAGPSQTIVLPSNVSTLPLIPTLVPISTGFNNPIAADYHQPTNKVVMSVNYSGGQPHNFELVAADGSRTQFSNISGLTDEVYIASARDEINGHSIGGFTAGEMFTGSGVGGVIVRISPDGKTVQNPWVTLPGEGGLLRGQLYIDRTGIFGGDLIIATTTGNIWRVTSSGVAKKLANVGVPPEGLITIPNDPEHYGPWAGKILTGSENSGRLFTIDTDNNVNFYDFGIFAEHIKLVNANENYFGVDFGSAKLWGLPAAELAGMVGDILIGEESPGNLWQVHWNGTRFEATRFAQVAQWEGATMAPAGIVQVASTTASVTLNGTVSDDGLPVGGTLTSLWTKVSGPGTVTFTSPATPVTTASFSQPGVYVLRLSATDSELTSTSDTTITISANTAPVVQAGPSQEITLPTTTANLTGTITDDGLPAGGTLSSFWTKVIGPAPVSFSTPTFDGTDNFSAVSNPSGPWTYGSTPTRGGLFTPYAFTGQVVGMPAWFKTAPTSGTTFPLLAYNNTGVSVTSGGLNIPPQTLLLHPGAAGENSVLRFTAPADGSYLIQGRFYGVDVTTTDVSILLNSSTTLLAGSITTRNVGVPFAFVKALKTGDKLDFSVGFGNGNNNSDSTGLQVIITQAGSASTTATFTSPGDYILRLTGSDSQLFSFSDTHVHVATPCVAPASGLVGWWPGDGDTRDLANGNAGVIEDGVTFVPGIVGQAFSLNGGAADVVIPASTALNVKSFTMDAWVFPLDLGVQRPIMEYSSTNGTIGVHLWENLNASVQITAGSVYANIVDSGGGSHTFATGGGALQWKRWNHVALTYDQATGVARIYVNGAFAAAANFGVFTPRTNLPLYIGARPNSNHFLGNIDEPQVYNRALSPAEVLAIYTAGNAGNCKPAGTQAPIVSAGLDHTITLPTTQVELDGTATDPNGGQLSIAWSVDSGAGPVTFANPSSATTNATFTNAGVYVVRLTASNSQLTSSSVATITVVIPPNTAPVVNAGPDQLTQFPINFVTLNGTVTDDGLPLGSTVTQQWSKLSGPGSVTFSNPTLPVTQATFSAVGTYTLKLTASDSQFTSSATVSVTVNPATNQPPAVNAGPDQTISLPGVALLNGTATDDGLPNGTLNIIWKLVSGPGAVIFTSPSAAVTKAMFSATGSYVLQLSATDTQFISTANVTITVTDPSIPNGNLPPVVSAGTTQSIVLPQNSVTLNGTVTDDGFPSGGTLSQFWTMVSGPGKVAFANPGAAVTTATFSAVGTYVLRLTANDSELSSSSDVTVKVSSTATPGGVFITGHDPDGHAWRGDNGTGAQHILQRSVSYVTFGKANPRILLVASLIPVPSDADPRPGLIASGFNVFDVADDGTAGIPTLDLHTIDFANYDVIIIGSGILQSELDLLNQRALELANFVNTGGGIVALSEGGGHGNTSHDRFAFLPFNIGPQPFNQDEFLFSLTPDGEALGLSAFDVNFNASHDIFQSSGGLAVIDNDEGGNIISLAQRGRLIGAASINNPPVVSAGADQILQLPANTLTLSGSATDDGLPTGSTLTTQWKQISGPAAVTFANPAQPQTQVTFPTAGVYVLRLIASDSQLFTVADVRITVRSTNGNQAPKVSAGTDQTINSASTFLSGAVTDDGLPVGGTLTSTWSVASGPGSVTFVNPSSPVTQVVFSVAGTYFLALTASDSELTSSDVVKIVVTAAVNLAPVVNAGADQTITFPVNTVTLNGSATDDGLPLGATLSFTWSELSGPAPVNFSNPTAAVTQAGFTVPGIYVLQLAVSDSALTGAATAKIIVNPEPVPPPVVSFTGFADGSEITKPTAIIGSVSSGSWKLEYSLLDGAGNPTTFVQFASGTAAVTNGTLGTFDPTVLLNGQYIVRFTSTDASGQTGTASATVDVSRNTKVGNFTLSFNDLSVPMPGLPITVTRTYDSRDKRVGDFGVGWTLSVGNVRVQKTGGAIGKGWDEEVQWSGFFPTYCLQPAQNHIVSVTFPDGRVYKFQPVNTPQCQSLVPIEVPQIGFAQIPTGSNTAGASLSPIGGDPDLLLDGAIPGPLNLVTAELDFADFTQFQLTTAEGFTYILDLKLGATSVTDPNGNTLTINANGIIHSSGKSVSFVRDTQNRITRINDPSGASIQYQYNAAGDLTSITDRANLTTTFAYGANHFLTDIIDPRGITAIKSVYDDAGRLVSTTDANGNTINYAPDLAAQHETVTDRSGNITVYEYDGDGNVTRVTDALGNVTTSTYDGNDNKLTQTNALGKTITYTYDAFGNPTSQTDALGNKTSFTYNSRRQPVTITDPLGRVTTNTYDANGNLLNTKDASGNITSYTYNSQGLPLTMTDPLNHVTTFAYDTADNVAQVTDASGNVSTFTYDSNGNKLTQKVTRTKTDGTKETLTTQYQYDGNNRLVKTINPDSSTSQIAFNSIGKQSDTFDALNHKTHFEFDNNGRFVKTTYPDGTFESYSYDANDRRISSTDRAGNTTSYTYDAVGRLTQTSYADNSNTKNVYDAAGQLIKAIDALGNVTQYGYDDAGRRISMTDPLGHVTSFAYDAAGNQVSITDALNHTTKYVYDSLNRRIKTIYPDQTTNSAAYDALGRQISKTDQAGKVTQFGYDALGRLTSVTQSLNGVPLTTTYVYDELGSRITQIDANGHVTSFVYDQHGRRISRTLPLGMSESYGYDAAGNLISKKDFNGHTTTYQYDNMNRLTAKTADVFFAQNATGAAQVSFTYTATGRRLSMTDASGATNYTYDNHLLIPTMLPETPCH